jgi:hypothetical protein
MKLKVEEVCMTDKHDNLSIDEIAAIATMMRKEQIIHLKRQGHDIEILMSSHAMKSEPKDVLGPNFEPMTNKKTGKKLTDQDLLFAATEGYPDEEEENNA